MPEAYETKQVGRYRVEVHHDDEWRNLARGADNVGRFSIPNEYGRNEWDWQDDAFTYAEAREHARGPILALPLDIWSQSYTIVRERSDWDGADGFYWAPLSKIESEGFADVDALRACLRAEVEELAHELQGNIWGYVVIGPDEEHVDSCWGFIGEPSYAMSEGREVAEWREQVDAINWAALPQWVKDAVLIRGDEWETYPPAPRAVTCTHCGRVIEDDDGTWFHPDTMSARCDGPDDEEGISWGDMVRQAEPRDATTTG